MSVLHGIRVALLEGRMSEELGALVQRYGGEPYCIPAVREQPRSCAPEVASLLDTLRLEEAPVVVFLTGTGVTALFSEAMALGREGELREVLRRAVTVCRGPKPVGALSREGVQASLKVEAPYTTADLLRALGSLELEGRRVALLHYGEPHYGLVEALRGMGALLEELLLYEWRLPDDMSGLYRLVDDLLVQQVGAIAFTSQVQVRHLFQAAAERGQAEALGLALRTYIHVAAVGPTCAAALDAMGVPPHVVPDQPKMGPMLLKLAQHVSATRGAS
jgi:uroporphyrinogen-III synthase